MKDSFYTPSALADYLISFVQKENIKTVADFSVGEGELLRAAKKRWPSIFCLGVDVSLDAINRVKQSNSDWCLIHCDFLENDSSILNSQKGLIDLILLNPPFSCIGGTIHKVNFDGRTFTASTAMTFLIQSIPYLSNDGCLFAILPNSVAYSLKDKELWKVLEIKYNINILEESNKLHFNNCSPNVILVSLNANTPKVLKEQKRLILQVSNITLFRGKMGMHKIQLFEEGDYLIHSTNLKDHSLKDVKLKVKGDHSKITGPAVLLPRVGNPNIKKVCKIGYNETYVLSDCVLAIKTTEEEESAYIFSTLLKEGKSFLELYKGTGARYITISKLESFLGINNCISNNKLELSNS